MLLLTFSVNTEWVIPLKDKKPIQLLTLFKKLLDESNRKPSKIWVDKGSFTMFYNEFYNESIKSFLHNNNIEMYSTHNEESVIAERFMRNIKDKIHEYKYMSSISKNVYIDKLDDIVNKYNANIIEPLKGNLLM